MNAFLLALVLTLGVVQAAPQTATDIVQGTVRRADTGEPIADVQISMSPIGNLPSGATALFEALPPGTQMTPSLLDAVNSVPRDPASATPPAATLPASRPAPIGAISDAAGHFILTGVPAGQYAIGARKDGYTGPAAGETPGAISLTTTPFPVVDGKPSPDISLTMVPPGSISGRVRDPDGMPLAGINVAAYQTTYVDGGRAVLTPRNTKTTDDRGDFRIFGISAGEYIVAGIPKGPAAAANPQDGYARTFFPGTLTPESAGKVVVKVGGDIADINFDLRAQNKVNVSGRVVSNIPTANDPKPTQFFLIPRDASHYMDSQPINFPNFSNDKSNGQFELHNVPPDSYELITTIPDGAGRNATGRTRVDVGIGNVQGVTINIHAGVPVKARIVYADGNSPANAASIRMQIRPMESYPTPFAGGIAGPISETDVLGLVKLVGGASIGETRITNTAGSTAPTTDSSGITTFPNVAEGRYTFIVTGLPPTAYVSDIRKSLVSIFDSGLQVTEQPPEIVDVVVSMTDTMIEGVVLNAEQKPGAFAKVVLVPQQSRRGNTALYRTASSNASGRFTLHGVPPGEYKIFAWQFAPPSYAWQNADFIARYEEHGQTVTVTPVGVASLQLQEIP